MLRLRLRLRARAGSICLRVWRVEESVFGEVYTVEVTYFCPMALWMSYQAIPWTPAGEVSLVSAVRGGHVRYLAISIGPDSHMLRLLGGSWVVISGVISRVTILIIHI